MLKDNTVFVGNKPVMNYVLAVVTQFNNGADEVAIKARGKAISRAVDTAEIAINRFLEGVAKKEILTGTEMIDTDTGKTNVSSIEIVLSQQLR
ncbi:MAG: DNA-binding protein Alba [Methanofollis liminatans]|jgi:DNA-binding protein|uniref:DNA/RNA-binding protein Alba n=3 Tax=Methanofollis TaxID=81416 RepID=A0A7K4HLF3_9EURY|nr:MULTISPECIES: DNA-binding protein Alba [Methanofollis]EJG06864.1 DNA/RNA-binding protein Alba [Methanofollis liminatans DSM 4140]MDD3110997.1 DNA-binding protein Alba [Methanofollis liminatans]NVO66094.1 DNA-binding protein Alba [Methanofollis tationis]HDS63004.1 DNA-binding protein Alba [Methanofollis liminatans]